MESSVVLVRKSFECTVLIKMWYSIFFSFTILGRKTRTKFTSRGLKHSFLLLFRRKFLRFWTLTWPSMVAELLKARKKLRMPSKRNVLQRPCNSRLLPSNKSVSAGKLNSFAAKGTPPGRESGDHSDGPQWSWDSGPDTCVQISTPFGRNALFWHLRSRSKTRPGSNQFK